MKIEDLEYLALEGGGGKGAVYLGAIRAIEAKLKESFTDDAIGQKKAVLDYLVKYKSLVSDDMPNTRIKGIAGSSAGGITAFALTLGLNSKEIEHVLSYPFEKFLTGKQKDIGKYRKVGQENGKTKLYIAQDKLKRIGLFKFKRQIGKVESKAYEYSFKSFKKINLNPAKGIFRNTALTLALDAIALGVYSKISNIQQLFSKKDLNEIIEEDSPFNYFFQGSQYGPENTTENETKRIISRASIRYGLMQLLRPLVKKPIKMDLGALGNLFWDRGLYSGFAVREFFFDLILFAVTRDTHFQREFLDHLKTKNKWERYKIDLIKIDLNRLSSIDDKWFEMKRWDKMSILTPGTLKELEFLKSIDFRTFHKITKIDMGLNVTNFTTNAPMFFSYKHTPDYPVLEAVAAAMSIPPGIKPLYSEADVYKPEDYSNTNISVEFDNNPEEFVDSNGNFSLNNYYLYEAAVKKYLSLYNKNKVRIDTNNPINRSAFLIPLREKIMSDELISDEIDLDGKKICVTSELLIFYYNAAYKGMFMDGGVTCNIPYNYFREDSDNTEIDSLKGVLALKLDNHYPAEWSAQFKSDPSYDLETNGALYWVHKKKLEKLFLKEVSRDDRIKNIRNNKDKSFLTKKKEIKQIMSNDELVDKMIRELQKSNVENNDKINVIKPWEKAKNIFGVIDTLFYGSEQGQVRYISDHNHIIPLYCYGIGTYDFDMKKISSLVNLAQNKAEFQVNEYFNNCIE